MSDKKETPSLAGGLTFGMTSGPYDGREERRKNKAKVDSALYGDGLLGDSLAPKRSGELANKFMIPPFTVFNAREGWWQDRKAAWLALGIQSELGRGGDEIAVADAAALDSARARSKASSQAVVGGRGTAMSNALAPRKRNTIHRADPSITVVHNPPPLMERAAPWVAPSELPSLRGVKRLCADVETRDEQLLEIGPGFHRGTSYIVGLGIGTNDGRRFYFPTRHEGGGNLDEGVVQKWAREELNAYDGELVGAHNIYDLEALGTWGVTFPNVKVHHDIQVCEPLLDEWRNSYTLEAIAQDYLGEGKVEGTLREAAALHGATTNSQIKKILWKLPAGYVGAYAEGDVDLPLRILPLQLKRLTEENLDEVYTVERKLIPILLAMRQRGIPVNTDQAEYVREQLTFTRDAALKRVRDIAGPQAELMAPESFAQAFVDRGLTPPLTPSSGKPRSGGGFNPDKFSITKDWLKAHQNDELAAALLEGRGVEHIINTYINGHILTHSVNGRVHCEFNQLKSEDEKGTIARFSSSNPNMQNLPMREEELAAMIRGMFRPEDGETWVRHDLSQIEYRLLAHFAVGPGSEECRRQYREDPKTDYHKLVATWLGIDPGDKHRRVQVKGINFAKGYGAGARKLAYLIGCSLSEAEEFVALYEQKLPFAKSTYDAAMRWAEKQGYVTTILGRRQRFLLWEPFDNYQRENPPLRHEAALKEYGQRIKRFKSYAALNRKLQGSGADVIKKGMVDAYEAGTFAVLGAPLVTVHDELGWSVPNTPQGTEACSVAHRCLEKAVTLKVPVYVDEGRGKDWGEASAG